MISKCRWAAGFVAPLTSLSLIALAVSAHPALAQQATSSQSGTALPPVEVKQPTAKPKAASKVSAKKAAPQAPVEPQPIADEPVAASSPADGDGIVAPGTRSGSLGVANTNEARADINRTPGGVDIVADTEYKGSTPATTIKDVLDYVPGVFVQPKWGDDTRLSIRGSGLSRNFHLRGLQLYMDGIPINTADGFGDFQEIDPTAYRYVEVYKGANALRFGSNSLGGAINFVMPTGYEADLFGARIDVGSFGFHKLSASSGGVAGRADYFITGTWQEQDGFRDHSDGESVRGALNIGYRLTEDIETRFYLNANSVDQRIPGSVTKDIALSDPTQAAAFNVANDWQRNIDTVRVANKTTLRLMPGTTLEVGGFYVDRHLMHPIFQWLDYTYDDYGGFARLSDERLIGGFKNRLVAGATVHDGTTDTKQYENVGGDKGALTTDFDDTSKNFSAYVENQFYFLPKVALVTGTQFLSASRDRHDNLLGDGDQSGAAEFDLWSPKAGLIWDVARGQQLFANVSRSAEIPSFGENVPLFTTGFLAEAQRGTTYEIGGRGRSETFNWDLALYRANIDNELMCTAPFPVANFCIVGNADKTIHQGIEAGVSAALISGIVAQGATPDRLWLNAAYTFSDFRFDNDALFGDNELPGAPRHFIRAELLYKHPSGIFFGPNVEWVPEAYYVDSANTLDTEAYGIWGLKLGYEGEHYSAYIEGRNLSDEAYIASSGITNFADPAQTALFEPGSGRAIYGGVQVKW